MRLVRWQVATLNLVWGPWPEALLEKGGGGAVMPLSIAVLNAFRLINALVAFFFFVGTKEKTGLLSTDRLLRLDEGK